MSSILRKLLKSISKSGSAKITGDATLSEGINITLTQSGNNIEIASSGGASNWGDLGGTLSDQTDLQTALDAMSTFKSQSYAVTTPASNVIELDDLASGWSDEYSNGTVAHISSGQHEGDGAIQIDVENTGDPCGMSKSVTQDYSESNFKIWVKSDDWANVGSVQIIFETDSSNYYSMHFKTYFQDFKDDEWYDCAFSRDQFSTTGSPSWGTITKIILRAWTDTAGTPTVYLDGLAEYPQAQRGVVSITFDDGWDSSYTQGLNKMEDYGYQGTTFIIPSLVGDTGRVTQAQVDEMHRKGWDISGHGATDLTTLTESEVETDVKASAQYLNDNGYRGANLYAYPNGQNTESVRDIVQKYFSVGRTINWSNQPMAYVNPLRLNAFSPINSTTTGYIQDRIDDAVNNGTWLILCFHKIVTTASGSTEYSIANFATIMDYLKTNNVDVQPISRVLARNDFFISTSSGDVVGPGSSTDNAITRYDSTTGKLLQNSGVALDDSNNLSGINQLTLGNNLTLDSSANAFSILDRGATNRFAAFQFKTAGTTVATVGIYNNSSNDIVFQSDASDVGRRQALIIKTNSDVVINEEGGDRDFRVEGDTATSLLHTDASTDRVGINNSTPSETLDVTGNIAVSGTVDGRDIAVDGTKLDTIETNATANPNAIDNVVEDTTPQLGGDLDGQSTYDINNVVDLSLTNDLLLGSGSIINFDSGDITLTHSSNKLTYEGGKLFVGGTTTFLNNANTTFALIHDVTYTSGETALAYDMRAEATYTTTANGSFTGSDLTALVDGSANMTSISGVSFQTANTGGSRTVTSVVGLNAFATNWATGATVTTAKSIQVGMGGLLGTTTTHYGIDFQFQGFFGATTNSAHIRLVNSSSNATNKTSLLLGSTVASGTWDIYQSSSINNSLAANTSMGANNTPTAAADLAASTTARSSLRIRSGTAPTSPQDGDIWQDGTNLKCYINGSVQTIV